MTRDEFFLIWLEAAIRNDWGERCPIPFRLCSTCRAWEAYDFLRSFIHSRERDERGILEA